MQMHDILRRDPEIWRLFTSAEEYNGAFRDGYDRFPHYMSAHRAPFEPRASRYLVEQGYRPEYPGGQAFSGYRNHHLRLPEADKRLSWTLNNVVLDTMSLLQSEAVQILLRNLYSCIEFYTYRVTQNQNCASSKYSIMAIE